MPGMNGRELAERLLAMRPGLPVLFMSGYTDQSVFGAHALGPETPYLPKPFTADELLRRVRDALEEQGPVAIR